MRRLGLKLADQHVQGDRPLRVGNRDRVDQRVRILGQVSEWHQFARGRAQLPDGSDHATAVGHRFREFRRFDPRVLRDGAIAERPDRAHVAFITRGVHHDVAFRIHAHRVVADIGRTHAQPLVVDDHDFRMDVDAGTFLQPFYMRVVNLEPMMHVSSPQ